MKILVVAATKPELACLPIKKINCDILFTGVGTAATIFHLQGQLAKKKYDLVIQAGIAGSFDKQFPPGAVVAIERDIFGDTGFEEKGIFTPLHTTKFAEKKPAIFKNGWLVNKSGLLKKLGLPLVAAVTVNKVSDSRRQTQQMRNLFHPQAESMEGAAFHYTCLKNKIPFLQLRSISNYVGTRNKADWKMEEAIKNLCNELDSLLSKLNSN